MTQPNIPTNTINLSQTGASKKSDELGMREMQARAYAKRGHQYLWVKYVYSPQNFGYLDEQDKNLWNFHKGCCEFQQSDALFLKLHHGPFIMSDQSALQRRVTVPMGNEEFEAVS